MGRIAFLPRFLPRAVGLVGNFLIFLPPELHFPAIRIDLGGKTELRQPKRLIRATLCLSILSPCSFRLYTLPPMTHTVTFAGRNALPRRDGLLHRGLALSLSLLRLSSVFIPIRTASELTFSPTSFTILQLKSYTVCVCVSVCLRVCYSNKKQKLLVPARSTSTEALTALRLRRREKYNAKLRTFENLTKTKQRAKRRWKNELRKENKTSNNKPPWSKKQHTRRAGNWELGTELCQKWRKKYLVVRGVGSRSERVGSGGREVI